MLKMKIDKKIEKRIYDVDSETGISILKKKYKISYEEAETMYYKWRKEFTREWHITPSGRAEKYMDRRKVKDGDI